MNSLPTPTALAVNVMVKDESLAVELADGRVISVPLVWYPRLVHGDEGERNNWLLLNQGGGIRWPALDEDISVENLLVGKPSDESQASLKLWLAGRLKT